MASRNMVTDQSLPEFLSINRLKLLRAAPCESRSPGNTSYSMLLSASYSLRA